MDEGNGIYADLAFAPELLTDTELKKASVQMLTAYLPNILAKNDKVGGKTRPKRTDTATTASTTVLDNLTNLVDTIYKGYHKLQYHGFAHAVDVTHMMFMLVHQFCDDLANREKFYLLLACLCHDLGHFGIGNGDLCKGRLDECTFSKSFKMHVHEECVKPTVMENFHLQSALEIIESHPFFAQDELAEGVVREIRVWLTSLILATDLGNQKFFLSCVKDWKRKPFKPHLSMPDLSDVTGPAGLCLLLIKVSDMGNVFRNYECARRWTERVMIEMEAASMTVKAIEENPDLSTNQSDLLELCQRNEQRVTLDLSDDVVNARMISFASMFVNPLLLCMKDVNVDAHRFLVHALKDSLQATKKESGLFSHLDSQL